ncbi:MAG: sigma-70 family RNA polymerase sigma factor [Clostridia bacterium]|nr:sigma-70 family RNA polymerase sigma factor [Clostridia bacterium]MDE7216074.1 sigma-70 family RNA polymerase sigma factor [Clostridia bacterium]
MKSASKEIDREVEKYMIDIRQGNTDSIAKLFELTYKGLYCVAFRYCQHAMTAEDLVAEIFANIEYIAAHYKAGHSAFNYLCKSIKNKYLNTVRAEKRRPVASLNENILATKQSIDDKVTSITIREGLKLLDDEEYRVIYCKFYMDMTFREIAKETGRSLGSVERTYKRAIGKLKDYL